MILKPKFDTKAIHKAASQDTHRALQELIESAKKQFNPFDENHDIYFDENEDDDYVELLEDFTRDINELETEISKLPNEYNKEKIDSTIKKVKSIYGEYAGVAESWLGGGHEVWMSFD